MSPCYPSGEEDPRTVARSSSPVDERPSANPDADNPFLDDFEARSPDELSFLKGDRIQLVERDDDFGDGWYLGKHMQHGKTGLFPEGTITA